MVFKRLQALAVIEVDSKEQVTAEDDQKQPLTAYNYVEYRLYNKNLTRYLDLASPQELLAARVLQGLRGTPAIRTKEGRLLHAESLKNHVWNSMPIAERQLFIKPGGKEDDVYGGPQPILDDLVRIVNQLGRAEGARPAMILPGGTQGALLHPRGLTLGSTFFKEPRQQEPQQSLLFPKRNPNV